MRDKIDILLQKYFRAETMLDEEKILKKYFQSKNLPAEHEKYRNFFYDPSEKDKKEKKPTKIVVNKKKRNLYKPLIFVCLGIAIVATSLSILEEMSKEDCLIIHGEINKDPEYIQKYTIEKLEKTKLLLSGCLAPLENISKTKRGIAKKIQILERQEKKANSKKKAAKTEKR